VRDWDLEVARWSLALIVGVGAFALTRPEAAGGGDMPMAEEVGSGEVVTEAVRRRSALAPPAGTLALSPGSIFPGHCVIRFAFSRLDPELEGVSLFGVSSDSRNPTYGWLPLHRVEAQATVRRGRAWGADPIGLSPDRFDEGFILFPFDSTPEAVVSAFHEGRYLTITSASGAKGSALLKVVNRCAP
jgi:hypothetical protein